MRRSRSRNLLNRAIPPPRAGFSLVELLVVISIVVLLVALLLPAMGTAQGTARRVVCQSNQRQIGVATLLYAHDYKDRLTTYPLAGLPATTDLLLPYVRYTYANLQGPTHLFFCPGASGKPGVTYDSDFPNNVAGGNYLWGGGKVTYGFNTHVMSNSTALPLPAWLVVNQLSRVSLAGKVFWGFDSWSHRVDWWFPQIPNYRHGGDGSPVNQWDRTGSAGVNALFLDGHVEWLAGPAFADFLTRGPSAPSPWAWF